MKSTIYLLLTGLSSIAFTTAQSDPSPTPSLETTLVCPATASMPACALPCINSAASQVSCATDNIYCQCVASTTVESLIAGCLLESCAFTDIPVAQSVGSIICEDCGGPVPVAAFPTGA
ncbi:hypothetical protein B0T17DRAFT_621273 [Bombardia bombarda]|uniref:CFEM domain-containing protein n=1 Tax=Bombardia bombarda TaxID=252184 RepID=A0AA39U2X7_9PEZI|nr:hypothetical protein B0T17DRAFT_621273 [Bombardia bombarda]